MWGCRVSFGLVSSEKSTYPCPCTERRLASRQFWSNLAWEHCDLLMVDKLETRLWACEGELFNFLPNLGRKSPRVPNLLFVVISKP